MGVAHTVHGKARSQARSDDKCMNLYVQKSASDVQAECYG